MESDRADTTTSEEALHLRPVIRLGQCPEMLTISPYELFLLVVVNVSCPDEPPIFGLGPCVRELIGEDVFEIFPLGFIPMVREHSTLAPWNDAKVVI